MLTDWGACAGCVYPLSFCIGALRERGPFTWQFASWFHHFVVTSGAAVPHSPSGQSAPGSRGEIWCESGSLAIYPGPHHSRTVLSCLACGTLRMLLLCVSDTW